MDRLLNWLQQAVQRWREQREHAALEEADKTQRREKITVFAISWVLAVGLWFLVNLSKNFTVSIQFPLQWGEMPAGKAPVQELPGSVEATVYGEGWMILSLKNNTPPVKVDAQAGDVNVYEMIRVIMNSYPQAAVTKVFPTTIQVQLDDQVSRRVPVVPVLEAQFSPSHAYIGSPVAVPDSITITGARALVETITGWQTAPLRLRNVKSSVDAAVPLSPPPDILTLSVPEVRVRAQVSEYTEGESRVAVRVRGVPQGRSVTFSPSVISVRYDVPVGDYQAAQDAPPFEAWVEWREVAEDSSGFVSPTIVAVGRNRDIRLRAYQPRRVAYYFNEAPLSQVP